MNISSFSNFTTINESSESNIVKNIIDVLSVADNPLTVSEILSKLPEGLTAAKNPRNSISTRLNEYSNNSNQRNKSKKSFFHVVSENPLKFWLIDRMDELDDLSTEDSIEKIKTFSKNPFQQAICVLGDSGAGKSYSIENILKAEGHEYDFIIPTAATTGLLAQYSPRKKEYVPSRLSKLIIDAYENPQDLYTAVFDECHKSNVIEMINDELLQAISQRRNAGKRFISLDSDTAEQVFDETDIEIGRNIQIPDNLGFIFISSNPRVIGGNPDFFNRVDLVEITEENRSDFKSSSDLISKSLKVRSEKLELIEKLRSN